MLPKSFTDKIQGNVSEPYFWKFPSLGKHWKSKSMRIIPEDFVRSTKIEHRVVCSVRWGNSWQFWIEPEKKGLVILKEDWDEFVDTNLLGPDNVLVFEHEDTMFLQLRIFKKNGEDIISAPEPGLEPGTEPVHPKPEYSQREARNAFTSGGILAIEARWRQGTADDKNHERYLLNPKNPYFVKTLTKNNYVLNVRKGTVQKFGLKFAHRNTEMTFLLPQGNMMGFTKMYGGYPSFSGWKELCQEHNLKTGDTVVCELELEDGVVDAVRVHFVNE